MNRTIHYIYKTTNQINGRFYIGKHTTNNIDDGYLGSGKVLLMAIKKYGINNFAKNILMFCESEVEAYKLEVSIVNGLSDDPMCYNMKNGGRGGMSGYKITKETKDKLRRINLGKNNCRYGIKHTIESKIKMSKIKIGKKLSVEHIRNISKGRKGIVFSDEHKANLRCERPNSSIRKKIYQIDKNTNIILNTFASLTIATKFVKAKSNSGISQCANGIKSTAMGYKWQYIK